MFSGFNIEDFEVFTVFSPYRNAMNLALKHSENCQFFVFRKNKPKPGPFQNEQKNSFLAKSKLI